MQTEDTKNENRTDVGGRVDQLVMCQREYEKAVKPYIKVKTTIYNCASGMTFTLHKDQLPNVEYRFTEEQKLTLRQLDELIEATRAQILGAITKR